MRLLLKITQADGGFRCDIHRVEQPPPLVTERMLASVRPLARDELLELLMGLGFHQRDIMDAIAAGRCESIDPESEQGKTVRGMQEKLGWRKG